jgi:hypothetical protein
MALPGSDWFWERDRCCRVLYTASTAPVRNPTLGGALLAQQADRLPVAKTVDELRKNAVQFNNSRRSDVIAAWILARA